MKKGVLLGASVLATGGVVGGGILLSGALNNSGAVDKDMNRFEEMDAGETENVVPPQRLDELTSPPSQPTFLFSMNPTVSQPQTLDHSTVDELPEEDDAPNPTVIPLTVDYEQKSRDSDDHKLKDEGVNYTITDPSLVLVESFEDVLEQDKLQHMINFLDWENASFEDHIVDLPSAQKHLDNLLENLNAVFEKPFDSLALYTYENLLAKYKEWLGLWDEKIKSSEGESEKWESMRNKYVDDILKKHFWKVFLQEISEYQAKLSAIEKLSS